MEQLLCHLFGDYILQSHYMATEKGKSSLAALLHVALYGIPFVFLQPSLTAFLVIVGTHFFIDRFRLARYAVYAKNFIAPQSRIFALAESELMPFEPDRFKEDYRWENCRATGYPPGVPAFLAVWLLIIADNTLHLAINYFALKFL